MHQRCLRLVGMADSTVFCSIGGRHPVPCKQLPSLIPVSYATQLESNGKRILYEPHDRRILDGWNATVLPRSQKQLLWVILVHAAKTWQYEKLPYTYANKNHYFCRLHTICAQCIKKCRLVNASSVSLTFLINSIGHQGSLELPTGGPWHGCALNEPLR